MIEFSCDLVNKKSSIEHLILTLLGRRQDDFFKEEYSVNCTLNENNCTISINLRIILLRLTGLRFLDSYFNLRHS